MSTCHPVRVFDFVRTISPEPLNHIFFTKLCMVVYYHEAMCHAEKLVHYFQCQGHSKGLYNQNMTFYYIFRTAGLFATKLGLIVQHHKPECPVEKWDYCVQGEGHSKGSKCQ